MKANIIESFGLARRRGVPLVAITTADTAATIAQLQTEENVCVRWDTSAGFTPVNQKGRSWLQTADFDASSVTLAGDALVNALTLPEDSVVFFVNLHRFLASSDAARAAVTVQGLANLREPFKSSGRTCVIVGPEFVSAPELGADVLVLDEPLPNEARLGDLASEVASQAQITLDESDKQRAATALRGLAPFAAEQAVALSLQEGGVDFDTLLDRKRQLINSTRGLTVHEGGENFSGVGGNEAIKADARLWLSAKERPDAIVWVDEIEKVLGGSSESDSGVSKGILQSLLTSLNDEGWTGAIFLGAPGCAKSLIAKAIGGEGSIPTISFDINSVKASLVGESETNLRNALRTIKAIGGSRVTWVATCNKIATLPIELRRRFKLGTRFFDIPNRDEKKVIWDLYILKYGLEGQPLPDDTLWSGSDIANAAYNAWNLGITLREAATRVIPVAISGRTEIETLRRESSGKYLSAAHDGAYVAAPLDDPQFGPTDASSTITSVGAKPAPKSTRKIAW